MIISCNQAGINLAVQTITKGGLVVFPTDTVYGLGCDPRNPKSVEAIYQLKNREKSKHFPLLAYSKEVVSMIADFDEISSKIADKFWPGPVTIVLEITDPEIKKVLGLDNRIAIRVPNNGCILSLLKECKIIVGTSANFSGKPAFSNPKKVLENFSGFDVFLDGGIISEGKNSTIVEVKNGKVEVLRQGNVTKEEIIRSL